MCGSQEQEDIPGADGVSYGWLLGSFDSVEKLLQADVMVMTMIMIHMAWEM